MMTASLLYLSGRYDDANRAPRRGGQLLSILFIG